MFQRQTRESFSITNILVLAMVVVAFLVYILKSVPRTVPAPAPPDVSTPANDSGYMEVRIDSFTR